MEENTPSKVGTFLSSAVSKILNLVMILVIIALAGVVVFFWNKNQLLEQENKTLQEQNDNFTEMNDQAKVRDVVVKEDAENKEDVNKENENMEAGDAVVTNSKIVNDNTKTVKTSRELLEELLMKDYNFTGLYKSNSEMIADYKIYKEVKSPYSNKTVVLYGTGAIEIKDRECNPKAGAIFINNNGVLGEKYYVQGSCAVSLGNNIKWQDDNTVLFEEVISTEGGISSTQEILKVK